VIESVERTLEKIIKVLRAISNAGIWIAGALLVLLSVGVGIEVISRRLLGHSLGGMDEIGGYVLAITATLAFTEALFSRSHIRIGVFHEMLGAKSRAVMDVAAMIGLVWFVSIVLWFGWTMLERNWGLGARSMTPLRTPLWIPQTAWVAAMAMFYFSAILLLLRAVLLIAAGDWAKAASLIGFRNESEELESELALSADSGLPRRGLR